jgi:hypothetical protein
MLIHLDKYLWIVFLLYAIVSTSTVRAHLKELHGKKPRLGSRQRLFLCGYFLFFAAPFLVIGAGTMSGATQGAFTYLSCDRGAFVWTFVVVVLLLCWSVGIWIWFFRGAEFLMENEILKARSVRLIKLQYGIGVLAVSIVLMRCGFYPPAA